MRINQICYKQSTTITANKKQEIGRSINKNVSDSFELSFPAKAGQVSKDKVSFKGNSIIKETETISLHLIRLISEKSATPLGKEGIIKLYPENIDGMIKLATLVMENSQIDFLEHFQVFQLLKKAFEYDPHNSINNDKILTFAEKYKDSSLHAKSLFTKVAISSGKELNKVFKIIKEDANHPNDYVSAFIAIKDLMKNASNYGDENVSKIKRDVVNMLTLSYFGAENKKKYEILGEFKELIPQIDDKNTLLSLKDFLITSGYKSGYVGLINRSKKCLHALIENKSFPEEEKAEVRELVYSRAVKITVNVLFFIFQQAAKLIKNN